LGSFSADATSTKILPVPPAGRVIDSAQTFAEALLEESLVALVPGEDFGDCARSNIRVSYACSEQQITEGLGRLKAFVEALR
jgi:aspartate/methionine/tyrosine aminotransferase